MMQAGLREASQLFCHPDRGLQSERRDLRFAPSRDESNRRSFDCAPARPAKERVGNSCVRFAQDDSLEE